MTQIISTFRRDANSVPVWTEGLVETKTITYVAGTTGAIGASDLFTVTGNVVARVFAVCSTDLAGDTATVEVGIAGNIASVIAQTTATDIDDGEIWVDTAPATVEDMPVRKILAGTDIIQTIGTAAVSAGVITYYCVWAPLSPDGNVTPA